MNTTAGQSWLSERSRAWAESLDVLAVAGRAVAVAATWDELQSGIADALCGSFADWVIVDLRMRGRARRLVAGNRHAGGLRVILERLPPGDCPPIASAIRRRTPVVQPEVSDLEELGVLPDGRWIADALRAGSYAVGPIVSGRAARGAITVVREHEHAPVSFLELNVLAHVGELTAGALRRIGLG